MTGLELARKYYGQCRPYLYERMPEVMEEACVGLCGEGSECFACDDETSRDHDFGAAFCLWLPRESLRKNHELIEDVLGELPASFMGFAADFNAPASRRGARSIEDYYLFFTGLSHAPETWREWQALPEIQLAAATNGEIFEDNGGAFSAWRKALLVFYPEDVRKKKIAARCMQMAQSGQYNLPRALQRKEGAAAMLAAARFAESAISLVFLLNRRYMPFYKWAPRLGRKLPVLGRELAGVLDALAGQPLRGPEDLGVAAAVEDFCAACAGELNDAGISPLRDSWLWAHGPRIVAGVRIPELRAMDLLKD